MSGQGSETTDSQWLELFFDLVVVAAVAVITERVSENPTVPGVALAAVAYVAIWQSWLSVVMYANVAVDAVRTRTVVAAMFAIALMAASVPGHYDDRANVFVLGFLVVRSVAANASRRTGRVLVSYPLLQAGGLSLPWIVSLWVPAPGKYGLWALALALDLVLLITRAGGEEEQQSPFESVAVDTEHLDERFGLYLIIVLGEVVAQIVGSAATTEWAPHFGITVAASFALIVSIWWLMFHTGARGATHTRMATLAPPLALPLHLLSTFGIVLLASGLGAAVVAPDRSIAPGLVRIMALGLGLHLACSAVAATVSGVPGRWMAAVGVPCVLGCTGVALAATSIDDNKQLIVVLLLITLWAVGWSHADRQAAARRAAVR